MAAWRRQPTGSGRQPTGVGRQPTEGGAVVQAKARPRRVAADPAKVIPGSDVAVLVLPAFAHEGMLRQIVPFLDEEAWVGTTPGRGGFDYCAARVLEEQSREDIRLFGLQTLPWACRIQEYGQIVHVLGVKKMVDAASRPPQKSGRSHRCWGVCWACP